MQGKILRLFSNEEALEGGFWRKWALRGICSELRLVSLFCAVQWKTAGINYAWIILLQQYAYPCLYHCKMQQIAYFYVGEDSLFLKVPKVQKDI